MNLAALIDYFIHPDKKKDFDTYRRSRLFVRASLLTSLFSNTYLWLSVYFEFPIARDLMIFNVFGFLILAIVCKARIPIKVLGHFYVLIGAVAVVLISYFSGGIWSSVYPWIISIPVLALLVVGRTAGIVWGILSFVAMVWMGLLELQGVELPTEYNVSMRSLWFVTVVPGLLLIIMVVSLVFETTQTKALKDLQVKNTLLEQQKQTIGEQSKKLEKLIDDKDHIIRILAHDLKNPLANITTISNILKEEREVDQQKKFIAMIERVSGQAQNLVSNVLNMATMETGAIKLKPKKLSIKSVVKESIESLSEQARQKEITIDLIGDDKTVYTDHTYLLLIFENLLSNALKFSEKGMKVEMEIRLDTDYVKVLVKDEGPGIQEDEEGQLFEQFSKLSARPTAEESSSGLGLSLVKRYTQQIGGRVWYDREESKGATFVVQLPVVP